jgi:hypothetical protein
MVYGSPAGEASGLATVLWDVGEMDSPHFKRPGGVGFSRGYSYKSWFYIYNIWPKHFFCKIKSWYGVHLPGLQTTLSLNLALDC